MSRYEEFQIAKLKLKPGDVLVFKHKKVLSREAAESFQIQALDVKKKILPMGVNVLTADASVDLSVLTFDEIQRRKVAT